MKKFRIKFFIRLTILYVFNLIPSESLLRLLFHLDRWLYYLQGQLAINYGNGIHPKHRLIRYHDFFVNRINTRDRVLDIGCGNGVVAYDIADRARAIVVGVDINAKNVKLAREIYSHPKVEFICGDIQKILPEGDFDVVILSNVLEHLKNRSVLHNKLQLDIQPYKFLIRVPMFERDWRVPLKKELGVEWRLDPTHEIEYSLETFTQEIQESGLQIHYMEVRWGEIWADVRVK